MRLRSPVTQPKNRREALCDPPGAVTSPRGCNGQARLNHQAATILKHTEGIADVRFLPAPTPTPERMQAVLAQVHEAIAPVAEVDNLDLDPALAACVQLALADPHCAIWCAPNRGGTPLRGASARILRIMRSSSRSLAPLSSAVASSS